MTRKKKLNAKTNNRAKAQRTGLKDALFIAGLIFILYFQTLNFDFVNWDDQVNVYENENVVNFNVKAIFSEPVIGNYNPLSNFTFALEYLLVQDSPGLYHFTNVLLHIVCSLLVYLLMKRLGMSVLVSFLSALFFGIHPMRVESVAWITERKDVLFGVLYLASILFYTSYHHTKKRIYYFISLIIFSLSLLSKIQAVSLPFSLLLIDYWQERKLSLKTVMEKTPYFLLSLITGLAGIYFLREQGSLELGETMSFFQRLFIGSYSFMVYIIKSIIPVGLSALYTFPTSLSIIHYLSMAAMVTVLVISVYVSQTQRFLTFGLLFFTLNIVFVLQVVGAGQGFLADRFTYIPYLGLFFIYAVLFEKLIEKFPGQRVFLYSSLVVYLLLISVQTNKQIKVWENSETLWTDVIKKHPKTALAHNNLAHYYTTINQAEKALGHYNTAIALQPNKAETYNNRGKIYFERGDFDKALNDYNKSLSLNPAFMPAMANRGAAYGAKSQLQEALADFTTVMESGVNNTDVISNRGFIYYQLKEYEKAIADCRLYLQYKPDDSEVINIIAISYAGLNDFDSAIAEYNRAIHLNPTNALFHINRSYAHNAMGNKKEALKDALKAQNLGLKVSREYIQMLQTNEQNPTS